MVVYHNNYSYFYTLACTERREYSKPIFHTLIQTRLNFDISNNHAKAMNTPNEHLKKDKSDRLSKSEVTPEQFN